LRIVTRPDFDGVVCAVLLYDVLNIEEPVLWVEPSEVQKGQVAIRPDDVLANLPYSPVCAMWFDHHFSNEISVPFNGAFKIAPSAAGVIFDVYRAKFRRDYSELVAAADKIDSANLTLAEVRYPETDPYLLISMTLPDQDKNDRPYWDHLVKQFRFQTIQDIMQDLQVRDRCDRVIAENKAYEVHLMNHTRCVNQVAITDFRELNPPPVGNRFLVYSLFPQCNVNVKIRFDSQRADTLAISVGHSIFNPTCQVNVGLLLQNFEGGGHRAAGACRFPAHLADQYIPKIIDALKQNIRNDS